MQMRKWMLIAVLSMAVCGGESKRKSSNDRIAVALHDNATDPSESPSNASSCCDELRNRVDRTFNFSVAKRDQMNGTIGAGKLDVHFAQLNISNLLDLFRIRVVLRSRVDEVSSVQIACQHPSDSVAFSLPTENGNLESGAMLGSVQKEDLEANGDEPDYIFISLSSRSRKPLNYSIVVGSLDRGQYNIVITSKKKKGSEKNLPLTLANQHASAVEPLAFRITTKERFDSLSVSVQSDDDLCAVASIQNTTHHLMQSGSAALLSRWHVMFARKATFNLPIDSLASTFSLLFFVMEDDFLCNSEAEERTYGHLKKFDVVLSFGHRPSLFFPMTFIIGLYILSAFAVFGSTGLRSMVKRKFSSADSLVDLRSNSSREGRRSPPPLLVLEGDLANGSQITESGTVYTPMSSVATTLQSPGDRSGLELLVDFPEANHIRELPLVDFPEMNPRRELPLVDLPDATLVREMPIVPEETTGGLTAENELDDAGRTVQPDARTVDSEFQFPSSKAVLSYVIIVPVALQTAYTFFSELANRNVDSDVCYFNFDCATAVGPFRSFNNVFSNVGYFIFGLLFLAFVRFRYHKYEKTNARKVEPCFGILYGVGFALVAESAASSLYHVCPNSSAFRFDTPFIEILCVLVMSKLYGTRRRFESPRISIFLVSILIFYHCIIDLLPKWVYVEEMLAILQLLLVFLVVLKIFFGSKFHLDPASPLIALTDLFKLCVELRKNGSSPVQYKRLLLLCLVIFFNVVLSLLLLQFSSLLITHAVLYFTAMNMILYCVYYFSNKVMCGESWSVTSCSYLTLSVIFWFIAVFCYSREETNWMGSPAQSRALNSECVFLSFYDWHDLWHFSSSFAAFFSLMAVTVVDDDLDELLPHKEVAIF